MNLTRISRVRFMASVNARAGYANRNLRFLIKAVCNDLVGESNNEGPNRQIRYR
jgi:hypothetical protein